MPGDESASPGTVATVKTNLGGHCDYCGVALPPARNHNGIPRRFCAGNRCRSAWHDRERRLVLERAREALRTALAALASLDDLLK